ncbi:hypothetical protein TNCV_1623711 [Trichonephila clavipes]|nr:hypothetical protein TNCV_1623711 [Trichonephila clavipes]
MGHDQATHKTLLGCRLRIAGIEAAWNDLLLPIIQAQFDSMPNSLSSYASASSSNAREFDEQILKVKIILGTSTNKDTLSKEKETENENEETKLIGNDFAHYVGTPIDAERFKGTNFKSGPIPYQKIISKKMPREGAFHHLIIVSYPRQDKISKGNGCAIQHDFMLLTVRYVGFSLIEQICILKKPGVKVGMTGKEYQKK